MTWCGRFDIHAIQCPECKGDKRDPKKRKRLCPVCEGSGYIMACNACKRPAYMHRQDASGKYRMKHKDLCPCYDECGIKKPRFPINEDGTSVPQRRP